MHFQLIIFLIVSFPDLTFKCYGYQYKLSKNYGTKLLEGKIIVMLIELLMLEGIHMYFTNRIMKVIIQIKSSPLHIYLISFICFDGY